MATKPSDLIWKHFEQLSGTLYKCKIAGCPKNYSHDIGASKSFTCLLDHLRTTHKTEYGEYSRAKEKKKKCAIGFLLV